MILMIIEGFNNLAIELKMLLFNNWNGLDYYDKEKYKKYETIC